MTRKGGRSLWVAVPAIVLCLGVVLTLGWLAIPMIPVATTWVGDTLRNATTDEDEIDAATSPARLIAEGSALDCRDIYPDALWSELIWHGDVLLGQNADTAPMAAPELDDALAPEGRLTCTWSLRAGESLVSSLASVGADAVSVAESALGAQGFGCSSTGTATSCLRASGGTREEHVFRDGLWLVTVGTGWQPDDYGPRLAAFVWSE